MKKLRITITCVLSAFIAGCQGLSLDKIREVRPVYTVASKNSINSVFICLTTGLNEFRGDGRMLILTYPEGSKAEFSIGAMQAGTFKHYYLISLTKVSEGTKTEIQRSPRDYVPLSERELTDIAIHCTKTTTNG